MNMAANWILLTIHSKYSHCSNCSWLGTWHTFHGLISVVVYIQLLENQVILFFRQFRCWRSCPFCCCLLDFRSLKPRMSQRMVTMTNVWMYCIFIISDLSNQFIWLHFCKHKCLIRFFTKVFMVNWFLLIYSSENIILSNICWIS